MNSEQTQLKLSTLFATENQIFTCEIFQISKYLYADVSTFCILFNEDIQLHHAVHINFAFRFTFGMESIEMSCSSFSFYFHAIHWLQYVSIDICSTFIAYFSHTRVAITVNPCNFVWVDVYEFQIPKTTELFIAKFIVFSKAILNTIVCVHCQRNCRPTLVMICHLMYNRCTINALKCRDTTNSLLFTKFKQSLKYN